MADDAIQLTLKTIATGTGLKDTINDLAKVNASTIATTKGMAGLTQEIEKQMQAMQKYGGVSNTVAAKQGAAFNRGLNQFTPAGISSGNLTNNPLINQMLQVPAVQQAYSQAWQKQWGWTGLGTMSNMPGYSGAPASGYSNYIPQSVGGGGGIRVPGNIGGGGGNWFSSFMGGMGGAAGKGAIYGGLSGAGMGQVGSLVSTMGPAGLAFAAASTAASTFTSSLVDLTDATKDYIVESTMLAARVETLGVALNTVGSNAGYSKEEMAAFEEGVTKMNITTASARQSMLYMAEAQINFNYASKLARVAQDAAVIGNINSSEAFKRLVWAVERGEPRMLRYIGINVSFERAYARTASAIGKTVKELDEQEKAEIRVNEVLRVGARLQGTYEAAMTTASKRILSLQRVQEQIQLKVGDVFLKGLSEGVFALYEYLDELDKYLTKNQKGIDGISASLGKLTAEAIKAAGEIGKALAATAPEGSQLGPLGQLDKNLKTILAISFLVTKKREEEEKARNEAAGAGGQLLGIDLPEEDFTLKKFAAGLEGVAGLLIDKLVPGFKEAALAVKEMSDAERDAASQSKTVTEVEFSKKLSDLNDLVGQYRDLYNQITDAQEESENTMVIAGMKFSQEIEEEDKRLTESLMDNDIRFAEKNADIWEDYWNKLSDLALKNSRDIADAATDYSRDQAESIRKSYDDEQSLAIEYSKKRVTIERNLADEINKIKNDYAFESEELIRKRDAIGLLRLRRETAHRLGEVKEGAKTERETTQIEYSQALEEQSRKREIEKRELAIHYNEKLEDLARSIAREREDENINRDRRLDDAKKDWGRQRDEANRQAARRTQDLVNALKNDFAIESAKLTQKTKLWRDKLTQIVADNAWAVNAITIMWANLSSRLFGTGSTSSIFNTQPTLRTPIYPTYNVPNARPGSIESWYTGNYGQGGQVSWGLANSRYAPPAAPTYTGGRMSSGSRKMDINIRLDGNGILDDAGRSQVIGIVKEVVTNALAG